MAEMILREHDVARFKTKFQETEGCWVWQGPYVGKHGNKRPAFMCSFEGRKVTYAAARYIYTLEVGAVPEGMEIDHLCHNRACVNVSHLEPVTPRENKRRHAEWMMVNITHCPRGHEYVTENLVKNKLGQRICKACAKGRSRAGILGITLEEVLEREAELDIYFARPPAKKKVYVSTLEYKVDWENDPHCRDCGKGMYKYVQDKQKGQVVHTGKGRCGNCRDKQKRLARRLEKE